MNEIQNQLHECKIVAKITLRFLCIINSVFSALLDTYEKEGKIKEEKSSWLLLTPRICLMVADAKELQMNEFGVLVLVK